MKPDGRRRARHTGVAAALVGLALALAVAEAHAVTRARRSPRPVLRTRLAALLDTAPFAGAHWGALVVRLDDGRTLFARAPDKSFTPASVAKLFTTAAALDALGPDERPRTTLESDAVLDSQGRLWGDLHLVGRGDPNLSPRFAPTEVPLEPLQRLAEGLHAAGVRRVTGRLVGNESYFQGPRRGSGWGWDDLVWWYGAEVSALSFHDNVALLKLWPGLPDAPARLERQPESAYYTVEGRVLTRPGAAPEDLSLDRPLGGNRLVLGGALAPGAAPRTLQVALEDPARYAATVLAELLAARGVSVDAGVVTSSLPVPSGARVLASHEGQPLARTLETINKHSQNLHAELLLRALGVHAAGRGDTQAGLAALRAFLERTGLPLEGFELHDASGLSPANLVTPRQAAGLLAFMQRHPHAAAFRASLAVMGVDGTLKSRGQAGAAAGRVQAKTGGLRHVYALAGYAPGPDGRALAFAVFLNHYSGPSSQALAALDAFSAALSSAR